MHFYTKKKAQKKILAFLFLESVFWIFCPTIHPISPVILHEYYCNVMNIITNQNKHGTFQEKVSNHETKVKLRRLYNQVNDLFSKREQSLIKASHIIPKTLKI